MHSINCDNNAGQMGPEIDFSTVTLSNKEGTCITSKLICTNSETGPSYESLQEVFSRKPFRPSVNYSNPTSANISFTLYAVLGVNEKTQILTTFLWLRLFWYNEFLTWNPEECGGVQKISLPVDEVWMPDIVVYEFIDEDKSQKTPYIYVNHTGRIRYDRMMRVVSSCNLEIFNFPFDVQNCSLTFGSYMQTVKDVRVGLALPIEQISENSKKYLETSGEWELVRIEGQPDILKFDIDEWDIITFWVVIKRRPLLYVVNLLIPSAFLMVIDIMSFHLPPHSVDRASFKMTLLLGYTVFLLIMNDLLPSTTNGTPLIGIYFSVCLALMVLSLLETVVITSILHQRSMQSTRIPNWIKKLVLDYMARLICFKVTHQAEELPKASVITCQSNIEFNEKIKYPNLPPGGLPSFFTQRLLEISHDLFIIRSSLESQSAEKLYEGTWIQIAYVLDSLLYRLYLMCISIYTIVIICLWCTCADDADCDIIKMHLKTTRGI
ncbi:5-hydroxytryptamine receptor 3E-like [Protopterus annectens]|uniref:5-hydroxytryptamine receptor 3E-like n=1 Tax=Protopterus annectens TaxID=7888 RepID=UPI001CFB0665|nr:5-hydroxytryptamine receptor 3E-like [Protopterus annectens]